jgi:hypothetical protein
MRITPLRAAAEGGLATKLKLFTNTLRPFQLGARPSVAPVPEGLSHGRSVA